MIYKRQRHRHEKEQYNNNNNNNNIFISYMLQYIISLHVYMYTIYNTIYKV